MNPATHLALRHHDRACALEHAVPRDVIDVVVRVDNVPNRLCCLHADRREELACGFGVRQRVDDGNTVIPDNEASVGAPTECVDRGPYVRADALEREHRLARRGGVW